MTFRLLPAGAPRSDRDAPFVPGDVVVFEHNGQSHLASILGFKKGKYVLLSDRAREHELAASRLIVTGATVGREGSTREKTVAALERLRREAAELSQRVALSELWELLREESRVQSVHEIAKFVFGTPTPLDTIGLWFALTSDKVYFKRDKAGFEPRKPEAVEELRRAKVVLEERAEAARRLYAYLRAYATTPTDALPPLDARSAELLALLEELAADAPHLEHHREAKDLLQGALEFFGMEPHGSLPTKARLLLIEAQILTPWSNLSLLRYRPPMTFSQEAIADCDVVSRRREEICTPTSDSARRDLRHLPAITIDDSTTRDMDDAISLVQTRDGYELGIHISDVASLIAIDSPLDRAARTRATSIYLPERIVNMFPDAIAHREASLIEGDSRPVISVLIQLTPDFAVRSVELAAAIISVTKRYSYDEADELLEQGDPYLLDIYNLTCKHEERRIATGALKLGRRDVNVLVESTTGSYRLVELDESAPARNMIGELMIMANHAFASRAAEAKVPFLYRSQPPPDDAFLGESEFESRAAYRFSVLSKLKSSKVGTTPLPHTSLGLTMYGQVTSPIRRYIDLCNQRQIRALILNQAPPYSAEELSERYSSLETGMERGRLVQNESKRFWLLSHLKRKMDANETIQGTVTRIDLKRPLAELEEIYLTGYFEPLGRKRLGEIVILRILSVDPHSDVLRLAEVSSG